MTVQLPPIQAYYIKKIADQINSMGLSVESWLGASQLQESQLSDLSLTLPFPTFKQLIRDALALSQEPALGLLVGKRLQLNTHGILGYAMMNSRNILEALELFERYISLRTPLISARHEIHGKYLHVILEEPYPLGEISRPLLETVIMAVKNVLDFITLGIRYLAWVAFPFEMPNYSKLAKDLFGCEVRYDQDWAGFAIPVEMLDLPLKMNDHNALREAIAICQSELEKMSRGETLAMRVRKLLLEKHHDVPSLNVTARLFNLTPRTLHRHLLEEGTSYKQILEEMRYNLAREFLKAGHLSVQEVAYALGYTDIANFRRAFKRWEGVTPSEYRVSG